MGRNNRDKDCKNVNSLFNRRFRCHRVVGLESPYHIFSLLWEDAWLLLVYKRSWADSNRCTCRDSPVNLLYTVLFTCYSNSILESKRHTPAIGFCTFCFCFPAMPPKMLYNTLMLHFPHYNAWFRPIKSQKCPIKSIKQRLFSLILMLTKTHTVPGITTRYTKVKLIL